LQVEITPAAQSAFGGDARERLVELLLTKFRDHKYDDGLVEAVKFVSNQFASKAKP
jgi:hypothetical protein